MNEIRITDDQEKKTRHILENDPENAYHRILTEVLGDMPPPQGVERTFDTWSRVQTYDGYRASHFVHLLTTEYQ